VPEAYGAMCEVLAPRALRLDVDDERVAVRFTAGDARLVRDDGDCAVEFRTTRRTILDVIDARRTLMGAVLGDRLMMRGTPRDVLAFHDGLMAYVHGAVRARSFPPLLQRFRRVRRRRGRP
jgi:hypothetical protein